MSSPETADLPCSIEGGTFNGVSTIFIDGVIAGIYREARVPPPVLDDHEVREWLSGYDGFELIADKEHAGYRAALVRIRDGDLEGMEPWQVARDALGEQR